MTNIIFTVYSFTELYNKLKGLYSNEEITSEELLHNTSYIDIEINELKITNLIKRYKKIYYPTELINIEFYSKNWKFFLRINYNVKENNKWYKTSIFVRDIDTIGYNSYNNDIAECDDYYLQGRNRFIASNDEDKKYYMMFDYTLIGACPIKKCLRENLNILEKIKNNSLLED